MTDDQLIRDACKIIGYKLGPPNEPIFSDTECGFTVAAMDWFAARNLDMSFYVWPDSVGFTACTKEGRLIADRCGETRIEALAKAVIAAGEKTDDRQTRETD